LSAAALLAMAVISSISWTACAAPPNPPAPVRSLVAVIATSRTCWTGGALAGPAATEPASATTLAGERPASPDTRAVALRFRAWALGAAPAGGDPLARRVRLGANLHGPVALAVDNPLLLQGRVARGGDAVAWERALARVDGAQELVFEELGAWTEVLLEGTTTATSLGAIDVERPRNDFLRELSARGPYSQRVELIVGLTASGLEVVVGATRRKGPADEDEAPLRRSAHGDVAQVRATELRHDVALLSDRPWEGGAPLMVLVPSPLDAGAASHILFSIEVLDTAPSEALRTAAARRVADADRLYRAIDEAPDAERLADARALVAIAKDDGRRPVLSVLAETRGAPLAGELALVLDEAELAVFATRIAAAQPTPGPQLGWQLERAALLYAAELAIAATPPPALGGVLARRFGQAGRFPGLLEDVAFTSPDRAAANARWIQENRIYLEDSDASARLRALDWLRERGLAPEGYDALGTADARRAALRSAEASRASESAGQSPTALNDPAPGPRVDVREEAVPR